MAQETIDVVAATRALAQVLGSELAPFSVTGTSGAPLEELLRWPLEAWAAAVGAGEPASEPGRALGGALVEAGCVDAETMTVALPALSAFLAQLQAGPAAQASLGWVAAGFAAALRERTLQHQEQLYQALRRSRDAARAELVEETRFVNAILDHMEALVAVAALDGTMVRFNQAAQRTTGYSMEELNQSPVLPLTPAEDLPEVNKTIAALLRGPDAPRSVQLRSRWRTRDGQLRVIDWTGSLLFDDEGNFTHYVGTGIDITERLQLEAELSEARQKLAEREGLTQQRVARALHDGPVQDLMRLGMMVAEMQERAEAETPWTERQRLEELIPGLEIVRRELLAAATRLRQLTGSLRPPGLEEMGLRQALEAYMRSQGLEEGPYAVSWAISDTVDTLPVAMRTALYNIIREALTNVRRHSRASRVKVAVRVCAHEVRLLVRDNGAGFTVPDHLARLVRQQQFGLIGMQERVQLQGGKLKIESAPGRGTAIRARLPLQLSRR
jgi:PAS domain S-box-containing protein